MSKETTNGGKMN